MKTKLYFLINENHYVSTFIYGLIILNILCLIGESQPSQVVSNTSFFYWIEIVSVIVFSIEYGIRFWVSKERIALEEKERKHWHYALTGYGIIDLLSILPFYLPLLFPFDLRILRILRLLRLLRIFKLGRYSKSIKTITDILRESKPELFITVFIAFILLVLSSTLIFYAEHNAQPNHFSSIIDSFWWSLGALTTVGFQEANPITPLGKFLSGFIGVIGIGFVALPTGIISSALIEKVRSNTVECDQESCSNCGFKR